MSAQALRGVAAAPLALSLLPMLVEGAIIGDPTTVRAGEPRMGGTRW